ncbi:MAG: hydrogenase/urease maturation nickel metallochaperone HypA [Patescibacteria group bacterium]
MHDLLAAQDIVRAAVQTAEKNKLTKITQVIIRLGKIVEHNEELSPENLRFNFGLISKNTIAEGADLVIQKGTGRELSVIEVRGAQT